MTDKEFIRRTNLKLAKKARLRKKGCLPLDSAEIIASSSDPVDLVASQIQYRIIKEKASGKSGGE